MFALAYVILPSTFASLQEELDIALAPYRLGGVDDFPREQLAFDDVTPVLRTLHEASGMTVILEEGSLRFQGDLSGHVHLIDADELRRCLRERDLSTFSGPLRDLEPDFDRFAERFSREPRDPETGGYGEWLNPLGRWDWWDLGGRFDGAITGERRPSGGRHMISSGPSTGREMIGSIVQAFGGCENSAEAEIEANVEPVSALLAAARAGKAHAFPTAMILPHGACPDPVRWFDDCFGWHEPPASLHAFLQVSPDADHRALCRAAYERFESYGAAGIAYHL